MHILLIMTSWRIESTELRDRLDDVLSQFAGEASSELLTLAVDQPGPIALGLRPGSPYQALALVTITAEQPLAVAAAVSQALGAGALAAAPARGHFAFWLYEAITARIATPEYRGARHVHLAFTNPATGREVDYNAWYNEHMAHALIADGFAEAQRFRRDHRGDNLLQESDPLPYDYLTVYGLLTDNLKASEADMHLYATGQKPGLPLSDSLGPERATWVYTPSTAIVP